MTIFLLLVENQALCLSSENFHRGEILRGLKMDSVTFRGN